MSLQKLFLKNSITYKIYVYYNLYIRHKAHKKREFYSQWGEDRFIKDFFKNKSKGFYVDIGSFHPIMYSNTCCLFDIGWSGMNIDINQTAIDMFNIIRPNDYNICAAISDKEEKKDIYFDGPFSPVNTITKSFYEDSNKQISFKYLEKKKIITKKFNDIIKNIIDLPKINFLNIDCEGHDYSALRGFNLKLHNPDLVCIETHHVDNSEIIEYRELLRLLQDHNYTKIKKYGPSSIFIKS